MYKKKLFNEVQEQKKKNWWEESTDYCRIIEQNKSCYFATNGNKLARILRGVAVWKKRGSDELSYQSMLGYGTRSISLSCMLFSSFVLLMMIFIV